MIVVLAVWAFVRALLVNSATVSLENVALRHQLAVLQRSVRRPRLRRRYRIFWICLSRLWARWRSSLVILQPATVLAWHRQSYRRKLWMSEKGDVPFLGKLSCQPQSPGGNRGKGTPPMLKVITTQAEAPAGEAPTIGATLDDLARDGARRMIAAALQLEVAEYVAGFREARDAGGHALVVRNGTARPRP